MPSALAEDDIQFPRLQPNFAVLIGGTAAIALVSFLYLPWLPASASTLLGIFMLAGADIDARTFLLPNFVTCGATLCGLLAAPFLTPQDPWQDPWLGFGAAIMRAAGTALLLALLRWAYGVFRKQEGLGFGDIKLAAAVGAWLPFDTIPYCFGLATLAALLSVALKAARTSIDNNMRLPFGAYLCPALWLSFFLNLFLG
jgi:leader peptidase (prepilin peptidase)/N-methyltransferase